MSKIKVMIADDHALVREGISAFLRMSSDIEVVGEAADGLEAIEVAREINPDVILMDIAMPRLGGLEATIELKKICPNTKILIVTQYDDKEYVNRLLKAGVSGYILKRSAGTDLIAAIKAVSRGEFYLCPALASDVIDGYLGKKEITVEEPYERLTDREKQVLKLIAEGHTHKEIADMLNISAKTVIAHQTNLTEKLGISSRSALIRFALQKGIIK
ncbi:MAG: response regulator transcription factor [Nitrospirae bacterium]|nr:response regulator transcription factor [Nitrospirota bacterium]